MLIPVPGYSHLKIYVSDTPETPANTPTPLVSTPSPQLRAQAVIFLEVLCGQRPLRQLNPRFFSPGVISYARAHRRPPQPVRLCSLHLRDRLRDQARDQGTAELYGTCEIGGVRYGFTACTRAETITQFRILW
ncbi:hypothetical protein [Corynebacterium lowii]|uniref:Uncharacterized protein n=1 Tax=Corynebacterium lowii TaxID=1544413 RepID=A0A0Q1AKQ9_9CORY|nr:hypothetical protein [Corynebacterium lowii]KQB87553.1 hypothetical protein Clow_00612 [Corynebacterium lowii]MDP9851852.1 hypothetical protein [Corynebacterium lowii]